MRIYSFIVLINVTRPLFSEKITYIKTVRNNTAYQYDILGVKNTKILLYFRFISATPLSRSSVILKSIDRVYWMAFGGGLPKLHEHFRLFYILDTFTGQGHVVLTQIIVMCT